MIILFLLSSEISSGRDDKFYQRLLSVTIEMILWYLFFVPFMCFIMFTDLSMLKHLGILWMKTNWLHIFFTVIKFSFQMFYWGIYMNVCIIYVHIYVYMYAPICTYLICMFYIYMHVPIYIYIPICNTLYVCYIYMHVHIYISVYIHIHTLYMCYVFTYTYIVMIKKRSVLYWYRKNTY